MCGTVQENPFRFPHFVGDFLYSPEVQHGGAWWHSVDFRSTFWIGKIFKRELRKGNIAAERTWSIWSDAVHGNGTRPASVSMDSLCDARLKEGNLGVLPRVDAESEHMRKYSESVTQKCIFWNAEAFSLERGSPERCRDLEELYAINGRKSFPGLLVD